MDNASIFLVKIDPGTDQSSSWGPGLALVFNDKIIKANLRPGSEEFGFFNGEREERISGMEPGKAVWLRMEIKGDEVMAFYSYDKEEWQKIGDAVIRELAPQLVRIGKMDGRGRGNDNKLQVNMRVAG